MIARRFHPAPASIDGEAWGVWDAHAHEWTIEPSAAMTEDDAEDRARDLEIQVRCGAKRLYRNYKVAAMVAARQAKLSGKPIQAYHCELHHGFHIGTPLGWRREHGQARGRITEGAGRQTLGAAAGAPASLAPRESPEAGREPHSG